MEHVNSEFCPTVFPGVTVVGAGTSGLSVTQYLLKRRVPVRVLEEASWVASAWRKRHPQLRLNTHRRLSALPGKPIPKKAGTFIKRDDYIAYLEAYADDLRLDYDLAIHFGTTVNSIESGKGYWQLHTPDTLYKSRYVVIATGTDRLPFMPHWNGEDSFSGTIVHAADFGCVSQYDGQHVLIVGGANSGIDIANHLSKRERVKSLTISIRNGTHILPTYIAGIPTQLFGPLLANLPVKQQDWITRLFSVLCFGNIRQYGLHAPKLGVASWLQMTGTVPGFDDGFVQALKQGRVSIATDIDTLSRDQVIFKDGRQLPIDHIICATGYRTGLDRLLPTECTPENDHYKNAPGLWIFGMEPKIEGSIYARSQEAAALAQAIEQEFQAQQRPESR